MYRQHREALGLQSNSLQTKGENEFDATQDFEESEEQQNTDSDLGDVIDGCRVLCSRTASDANQMIQERLRQCGIDPSILKLCLH